jgi:hypothetical protein
MGTVPMANQSSYSITFIKNDKHSARGTQAKLETEGIFELTIENESLHVNISYNVVRLLRIFHIKI